MNLSRSFLSLRFFIQVTMKHIFIGLGSNLGNREENLALARERLEHQGRVKVVSCSPLVETEPWGPIPQGWYLNQLCEIESELSPRALMLWLLEVERLGGRDRTQEVRWGPRMIDLDLLAYGQEVYEDEVVQVPHPRLHLRRFVLQPWAAIAPDWRHPTLGLSVRQMLAQVEDEAVVKTAPIPVNESYSSINC